jgi:hypothetical protein
MDRRFEIFGSEFSDFVYFLPCPNLGDSIQNQLGHTHPKTRECPATSSAFLPAENPSLNKCENGARMTKRHEDRNCETEGLLVPDQHAGYRFVDHFHRDQITPFEFIRLSGVS